MRTERSHRIKETIRKRQEGLTVVLENVHDPHNIGAVMRTCDAVGIAEIYVLYTEENLIERGIEVGYNSASGSRKWVEVHYFTELEPCFKSIRMKYDHIVGTHLSESASSLYELDLSCSTALVFGNERDGISKEMLNLLDGNFIIPQMGMVQSLNISVACAVSLFEASRQRKESGLYDIPFDHTNKYHASLWEKYTIQHRDGTGQL